MEAQSSTGPGEGGASGPFLGLLGFASSLHARIVGFGFPHTRQSTLAAVPMGNVVQCDLGSRPLVQPHFPACSARSVAFAGPRVGAGLRPGRRVPTATAAVRTRPFGGSLVLLFESQRLPRRGLRECPRLPSAEEPRGAPWSGDANPGALWVVSKCLLVGNGLAGGDCLILFYLRQNWKGGCQILLPIGDLFLEIKCCIKPCTLC